MKALLIGGLVLALVALWFLRSSDSSREKLGIIGELWSFMKVRKKWWLGPIVIMLALLGLLVVFTQGSAVAPFIYTLF
jgi:uncharacterized protein DUF5989